MGQKLYAANVKDGLVFLLQRKNDFWTLPGGVKDDSDNDISFLEESVGAVKPQFFGSIEQVGESYKLSIYICKKLKEKKDKKGKVINPGQWFDYYHLPRNLSKDSRESIYAMSRNGYL